MSLTTGDARFITPEERQRQLTPHLLPALARGVLGLAGIAFAMIAGGPLSSFGAYMLGAPLARSAMAGLSRRGQMRAATPADIRHASAIVAEVTRSLPGRLAVAPPDVVVLADDRLGAHCRTGWHPLRPRIEVTTGVLHRLPPDQARAMIAHQLAHIRSRDQRRMAPAHTARVATSRARMWIVWVAGYRAWQQLTIGMPTFHDIRAVQGIVRAVGGTMLGVPYVGLAVATVATLLTTRAMERRSEARADRFAAEAVSPVAAARALEARERERRPLVIDEVVSALGGHLPRLTRGLDAVGVRLVAMEQRWVPRPLRIALAHEPDHRSRSTTLARLTWLPPGARWIPPELPGRPAILSLASEPVGSPAAAAPARSRQPNRPPVSPVSPALTLRPRATTSAERDVIG